MRKSLKIPLLVIGGLVAAILLIMGGFLLGARDDLGSALRGLFPVVNTNGSAGDGLQQEVLDKLDETYYKAVDDTKLENAAIDGMVAALDDPYTVYWDPEEYAAFKQSSAGSYTGLGMTVEMVDKMVTIVSTFKNSPADEAGILGGDIVVTVDGDPVDGKTLQQVVDLMKGGPAGSTVTVQIYRPPAPAVSTTTTTAASTTSTTGADWSTTTTTVDIAEQADNSALPPGGEKKEFRLTRRSIEIPVTETKMVEAGGKKVAVIGFFTFSQGSGAALRTAVKKAIDEAAANAIVLDLRGNGGGLLDQAIAVSSIFLPEGDEIVSTQGLNSPKEVYRATGGAYRDVPLYVLTDAYTASASEIVSGALQDYHRATLVGETTFGKGLVQSIEPLSNGGALKATTAVYLTPKGRDINHQGIVPDVMAPDDPATTAVDETLEATLDLIERLGAVPAATTSTSPTLPSAN